jgi:peptidoglycan/xylan/chitin deacetylase (PgdA/CDA1 family)
VRLERDRWSIAVTPEHFAEHMEILRRRANVVPLARLDGSMAEPNGSRPLIAVTFDDGYADTLHDAMPVLRQFDLPATVFVASDPVVRGREFWWDDLERAVDVARYDTIWTELRDADAARRDDEIERARSAAGVDTAPRPSHRPLTADELADLARDVRVEIGGHTASHGRLAALPVAEQRREIDEGRRALESIVGRRIESFAYPFGRAGDYTAETMRLVRDAGFSRACINQPGRVDRSTDRFALPRVYVRDGDGDAFAATLRAYGVEL